MPNLDALLGRTIVLVPHHDDEAISCGILLQRMRSPLVVFATDGAPRDEFFWKRYGSRQAYAELRRDEAAKAMAIAGVKDFEFLPLLRGGAIFVDQELYQVIPQAIEAVSELITRHRADALLTLAYEGGHPDHDASAFIVSMLAREFRVSAWEMPIYSRPNGRPHRQAFLLETGEEIILQPTESEIRKKADMFRCYASQGALRDFFDPRRELFRPQVSYDYSQPPHTGKLNYEAWGWPISGRQLCEAFMTYRPAASAGQHAR
jgi:LmbE family N-acetylglucosaminyl deacetylase